MLIARYRKAAIVQAWRANDESVDPLAGGIAIAFSDDSDISYPYLEIARLYLGVALSHSFGGIRLRLSGACNATLNSLIIATGLRND